MPRRAVKLRAAMHTPMARYGGGLEWADREAFIETVPGAVTTRDPAPWFLINAISVTGDSASVQVENIWFGEHFDDRLTHLHHEGTWGIVSKVLFLRAGASLT